MIDQELLNILADPETKEEVELVDSGLIEKINLLIEKGDCRNRGGQNVAQKIDGGLIPKQSRKVLYPIRDDIPIMLIEEAIPLEGIV